MPPKRQKFVYSIRIAKLTRNCVKDNHSATSNIQKAETAAGTLELDRTVSVVKGK
jgi:hypothetical protein